MMIRSGVAVCAFLAFGFGSALARDPLRILAFGDSITASSCYPVRLWRKMHDEGARFGPVEFTGTRPADNCGDEQFHGFHSGHNCYSVTWVLIPKGQGNRKGCGDGNTFVGDVSDLKSWLSNVKFDVVLWHIGTNDTWGSHDTTGLHSANVLRAYSVVLDAMRKENPRVVVLVAQLIPNNTAPPPGSVYDLNGRIPDWAATKTTETSPIIVVDMYTGFDLAWTRDGVHPNDQGSQWIADRWFESLSVWARMRQGAGTARPSP